MHDLVPLLVQSLLLYLEILHGILLSMGAVAKLPTVVGYSVVAEKSALLERIVAAL